MGALAEFRLEPNTNREGTYILVAGESRTIVAESIVDAINREIEIHNPCEDGFISHELHKLLIAMGTSPDAYFYVIPVRPNS